MTADWTNSSSHGTFEIRAIVAVREWVKATQASHEHAPGGDVDSHRAAVWWYLEGELQLIADGMELVSPQRMAAWLDGGFHSVSPDTMAERIGPSLYDAVHDEWYVPRAVRPDEIHGLTISYPVCGDALCRVAQG